MVISFPTFIELYINDHNTMKLNTVNNYSVVDCLEVFRVADYFETDQLSRSC
jgi:hypothetical protein